MTQRNEEWGRDRSDGGRQTLVVEVIDESVALPGELGPVFAKHVDAKRLPLSAKRLADHQSVVVTYSDAVDIIRAAGFHPVDPVTKRLRA